MIRHLETSRLAIDRLLGCTGGVYKPAGEESAVKEYDWSAPCTLGNAQIEKVGQWANSAASILAAKLQALTRTPFDIRATAITQHYGDQILKSQDDKADLATLADAAGKPCGGVTITPAFAAAWVARLLGGTEALARELSALEKSLLLDLMAALLDSAAEAARSAGGLELRTAGGIEREHYRIEPSPTTEYCKIVFSDGTNSKPMFYLDIQTDLLVPLAGDRQESKQATAQTNQLLRQHLQEADITCTVQLGTAQASVKDIVSLEPGDILLIQRKINEPIELSVQGKVLLTGVPVVSQGCYALQVVTPPGQ